MEKTMNVMIADTKDDILKILVESKLPVMVVSMLIKDIKDFVDSQTEEIVTKERNLYLESLKTEQEKNN